MIAMGATNLPERAMRQQIASAIQLVVQQTRLSDGSRKVTSISEITGMEGDIITMQEIFVFEKMGVTQDGKVIGRFRATGVRPKCCERLKAVGHPPAGRHVRGRDGGALMLLPLVVFLIVTGAGARRVCCGLTNLPAAWRSAGSSERLREVVASECRARRNRRPSSRAQTAGAAAGARQARSASGAGRPGEADRAVRRARRPPSAIVLVARGGRCVRRR